MSIKLIGLLEYIVLLWILTFSLCLTEKYLIFMARTKLETKLETTTSYELKCYPFMSSVKYIQQMSQIYLEFLYVIFPKRAE